MSKEYILVSVSFPDKERLVPGGLIVPSEWVVYQDLNKLKEKPEIFKDECKDGTKFIVTLRYHKESEGDA